VGHPERVVLDPVVDLILGRELVAEAAGARRVVQTDAHCDGGLDPVLGTRVELGAQDLGVVELRHDQAPAPQHLGRHARTDLRGPGLLDGAQRGLGTAQVRDRSTHPDAGSDDVPATQVHAEASGREVLDPLLDQLDVGADREPGGEGARRGEQVGRLALLERAELGVHLVGALELARAERHHAHPEARQPAARNRERDAVDGRVLEPPGVLEPHLVLVHGREAGRVPEDAERIVRDGDEGPAQAERAGGGVAVEPLAGSAGVPNLAPGGFRQQDDGQQRRPAGPCHVSGLHMPS
jgi:hypothetical protein